MIIVFRYRNWPDFFFDRGEVPMLRASGVLCGLLLSLAVHADEVAWPELNKPVASAEKHAGDAAVIVAVERYAELPGVSGALKNAGDWQSYLTSTRGLAPDSVFFLRDNEGTVEKMRRFAREAAQRVRPGGTLWFVFIGHGAPAQDGKDGLLVGYDAQQEADSVFARSLPQKELVSLLGAGKQGKTVVVLDACFSGRAPNGKALVKDLQPLVVIQGGITKAALGTTTILSAAKSNQFAGPLPGAQRPAFSYLVLGALRGWADQNSDGRITAREIRDYTQTVLSATVKDRSQEPQLLAANPNEVLAAAVEKAPDLAAIQRAPTATAKKPGESKLTTVAVAEFRATGLPPDMTWLGRSFADATVTRLSRGKAVRVVEREFLDQIAAELKLQSSSAVDERTAVRMGRLLGARIFIFGSVSMLDDEVVVRARTVSVERGEVLDSAEATGHKKQLFAIQKELARQLSSTLAIEAGLSNDGGLEVNEMNIAAYGELDRLRVLARGLPFFGLDPARARKRSDYQLALMMADRLIGQYPKLALAHYFRSLFSIHNEELDRAVQSGRIAAGLGMDDVELGLARANAQYVAGDPNGALAIYLETVRKFPEDSRAFYAAARIFAAQNRRADAVVYYIESLQRQPALREAESNLQTLIGGPGAPPLLEELRATRPLSYHAAVSFASFWRHDYAAADAAAARAQAEMPALYMPYYVRGMAAMQSGQTQAAIGQFVTALSLRPTFPEVHRELGRVLLTQGDCGNGAVHVTLYMHSANYVDDYAPLEQAMRACTGR
jgi:TolB-like protein